MTTSSSCSTSFCPNVRCLNNSQQSLSDSSDNSWGDIVPMIVATFERRVVTKMEAPFTPYASTDFNFSQFSCSSSKTSKYLFLWSKCWSFLCSGCRSKSLQWHADASSMIAFVILFKLKSSETNTQILNSKWLTTLSWLKMSWESVVFPSPPRPMIGRRINPQHEKHHQLKSLQFYQYLLFVRRLVVQGWMRWFGATQWHHSFSQLS